MKKLIQLEGTREIREKFDVSKENVIDAALEVLRQSFNFPQNFLLKEDELWEIITKYLGHDSHGTWEDKIESFQRRLDFSELKIAKLILELKEFRRNYL